MVRPGELFRIPEQLPVRPRDNLEPIKTCTVTHSNAPKQTIVDTVTKRKDTYNAQVSSTKGSYTIDLSAKWIDWAGRFWVENPNFSKIIRS